MSSTDCSARCLSFRCSALREVPSRSSRPRSCCLRPLALSGVHVEVGALVAQMGPLVAMKLQAIMNRATVKQGTDLQDIARLILDAQVRSLRSLNSAAAAHR